MTGYDYQSLIDRLYLPDSKAREILLCHSRQVADKALSIAHSRHLPLDDDEIVAAAMVHDIGVVFTDAPGIDCHGTEHYLRHGILGAAALRADGAPEYLARVAERHTGTGITIEEIRLLDLPLPVADYVPETLLERLICYSDKFFSKNALDSEKSLERARASMARYGSATLSRFDALHREFGVEAE